jgi:hypothetical protein
LAECSGGYELLFLFANQLLVLPAQSFGQLLCRFVLQLFHFVREQQVLFKVRIILNNNKLFSFLFLTLFFDAL